MTDNPTLDRPVEAPSPNIPPTNSKAAQTIHRHSRFVSILRWALPLFCLAIVALFLFTSGVLDEFSPPEVKEPKPVVAENSVEMFQPRMAGLDEKKRAYVITAQSAKQDAEIPTRMIMENISGSLVLNERDGKIFLNAKSGSLDTESNFLQLRQKIVITSKKGFTAHLISADAELKKKYITSKKPVVIEWNDGTIKSNGLEITDDGNVIRFLNHVKVNLKSKARKKDLKE